MLNNSKLEEEIVASYRGIRKLLNQNFNDNFVITNLKKEYNSLKEALEDFEKYEQVIKSKYSDEIFVLKKIIATKYYLMSLLNYDIDYSEYIKNTIGVNIGYTEKSIIESLIKEIKDKLKLLNIEYLKEDIENKFYKSKMHKNEIAKYMECEFERQKQIVEKYLNLKFDESFRILFVNEEMPYSYYLTYRNEGYILKVNLSSIVNKFNYASLRYAISHEIFGHALQLSTWKKKIYNLEINQICGCEEDYGPEIFQLEGVAESLVYFIFENEIDLEMEIELLLDKLHHFVQNNAYLMYNNNYSLDICVEYYCKYYILSDKDYVKKRIKLSKENSFYRANLYVYGDCLKFFYEVCNSLNENQKRHFLNKMYIQPMTKDEITNYILALTRSNENQSKSSFIPNE